MFGGEAHNSVSVGIGSIDERKNANKYLSNSQFEINCHNYRKIPFISRGL